MVRRGLGHIGGDFSVIDILVTSYWAALRVDPPRPSDPDRDRFILSKGHCAAALYTTLARCGFFPAQGAGDLRAADLTPQRPSEPGQGPGVETNTGPLGHGFPVAVGCALGAKLAGSSAARSSYWATVSCRRAATGRRR